jgi:hypothetical protein
MRLKKKQKEAVIAWVAEGLETDEINERAAKFKPPFDVSRPQVSFYRETRKADLSIIRAAGEFEALTEGFAVKANRVKALQSIANLMYRDLTTGFLWLDQVKALGSGEFMETVEYEEFNAAESKEFRGVLDDIAKELGHRKTIVELSWRDEAKRRGYDPDQLFRDMVNAARQRLVESGSGGSVDRGTEASSSTGEE